VCVNILYYSIANKLLSNDNKKQMQQRTETLDNYGLGFAIRRINNGSIR